MGQLEAMNVPVTWRGQQLNVEVDPTWTIHELGVQLQKLTNIKSDTMKLLVPQSHNRSSRLVSPFSNEHATLSLREASILEGMPIRMMGAIDDEVKEVSQANTKSDLRIIGFEEEEKRLMQRAFNSPQASVKLPQGPYIFCDFRTLHLPGIDLNPPPSEALTRMHMLACDPGIIAIMNKHRWRVGIMTEMAPVGFVGISPKCILGFNKNQGEEISLRLRTDDLKGFRKYESIKKTLLHELAHMVYSEHDANFFALDSQLNREAASLDWTKSRGHTLSGRRISNHYDKGLHVDESSSKAGQKLGGASDSLTSARASSIAAAYSRFINSSPAEPRASSTGDSRSAAVEPDPDDSELKGAAEKIIAEPDPDDSLLMENYLMSVSEDLDDREPDPDDSFYMGNRMAVEPSPSDLLDEDNRVNSEPDPDDSMVSSVNCNQENIQVTGVPKPMETIAKDLGIDVANTNSINVVEPDPDDSEPDPDDSEPSQTEILDPVPDSSEVVTKIVKVEPDPDDDTGSLQRIEDSTSTVCSRIQNTIKMLRSEASPMEADSALQTLVKIIRNVIEHPGEMKFRRLRKSNPQIQRNLVKYKGAMEFLGVVGFSEDVTTDEYGRQESHLVLKRNDPGLLWLARSSLEASL